MALRPDFTSNLVRVLAFGTPKFYIAPYDKINHGLVNVSSNCDVKSSLRPDFTSKLVHVLAFGTPKFYIAPYDIIKHQFVNLSSNCDVKSGLRDNISVYIAPPPVERKNKERKARQVKNVQTTPPPPTHTHILQTQ